MSLNIEMYITEEKLSRLWNLLIDVVFEQGITLLLMGSAEALPQEPAAKTVFMEDMSEQQLASAVSSFLASLDSLMSLITVGYT